MPINRKNLVQITKTRTLEFGFTRVVTNCRIKLFWHTYLCMYISYLFQFQFQFAFTINHGCAIFRKHEEIWLLLIIVMKKSNCKFIGIVKKYDFSFCFIVPTYLHMEMDKDITPSFRPTSKYIEFITFLPGRLWRIVGWK